MRRVLSLWQPWATLCVAPDPSRLGIPPKQWETRSWKPFLNLPLAVAIHATKKWDTVIRYACSDVGFRSALTRCGFHHFPMKGEPSPNLRHLPLGAIIGVATVVRVETTEMIRDRLSDEEHRFGNYVPGRWAWKLEETAMLPTPIPFKGRQEPLYQLDAETELAIDRQLGLVPA